MTRCDGTTGCGRVTAGRGGLTTGCGRVTSTRVGAGQATAGCGRVTGADRKADTGWGTGRCGRVATSRGGATAGRGPGGPASMARLDSAPTGPGLCQRVLAGYGWSGSRRR